MREQRGMQSEGQMQGLGEEMCTMQQAQRGGECPGLTGKAPLGIPHLDPPTIEPGSRRILKFLEGQLRVTQTL